jgi:hypothetical protein
MARSSVRRWLAIYVGVGVVAALIPVITLGGSSSAVPSAIIDQTGGWPDAPYNSQYGTVNIAYHCNVKGGALPVLNVDLDAALTALFPLDAAAGQPFYVTDSRGTATFPAKSVNLLRSLGVFKISGHTQRFDLTADGATPNVINAAAENEIDIPKVDLVKDQALSLTLPTKPMKIGPYVATKGVVDIGVGRIVTKLDAYGLGGIKIPADASLDCASPKPKQLVALVPIGGTADPTGVDIPGHIEEANVPVGGGLLGAVIPVACTFPGYGTYTLGVNVNAYVPTLAVHTGQSWSFLSGHGYVRLPTELVDAFYAKHPNVASSDVELTELQTVSQNSFPEKQNYLTKPTYGEEITLTKGQSAFGTFPKGGTMLPPENSKAGKVGVMRVYLGEIAGNTQLRDAAGNPVGDKTNFFCPTVTEPLVPLLPYAIVP